MDEVHAVSGKKNAIGISDGSGINFSGFGRARALRFGLRAGSGMPDILTSGFGRASGGHRAFNINILFLKIPFLPLISKNIPLFSKITPKQSPGYY